MTPLFVAMVLAVFAGGVCLWLSGLFLGRRARPQRPNPAVEEERKRLADSLAAATERASGVEARAAETELRARKADDAKAKAEAELARAAIELGRVEGEMTRAEAEVARLKEENEALKQQRQHKLKPPTPTKAGMAPERRADGPENDELDFALAQLDMERVAHQKTRDELEQAKKHAAAPVQVSDGRPSVIPGPPGLPSMGGGSRRGAGFQTVSIASRGQPVSPTEHDRLRQLVDQLQRDKDRAEAGLARAEQELQLLRMRQQ